MGNTTRAGTTGIIAVVNGRNVGALRVRPGESDSNAIDRLLARPEIAEAGRSRVRLLTLGNEDVRALGGNINDIDLDDIPAAQRRRLLAGTTAARASGRTAGISREGQENTRQRNARRGANAAARAEQALAAARAARRRVLRQSTGVSDRTRRNRLRAAGADDATIRSLSERLSAARQRAGG